MNCVEYVCGVGGTNLPKPGDPNLNSITLTATPGFGGVNVNWSYPTLNAHAVSFTRVYRSTISNFGSAIEIAKAAGSRYFDPVELTDTSTYYYWIRLVSVNGTEGQLIGPALCKMQSSIDEIITNLSNKIDEGWLAQSLRTKISRISELQADLRSEADERIGDILALSKVVETLQESTDKAMGMITTEKQIRIGEYGLLVDMLNKVEGRFNDNFGKVQDYMGTLITKDSATSLVTTTAEATLKTANSTLTSALGNFDIAKSTASKTYVDRLQKAESAISDPNTGLVTKLAQAEISFGTSITNVDKKADAAQKSADGVAGDLSSLKSNLSSYYMVKLSAGDLVGGFGIYNNSKSIEAVFDVSKFSIGDSKTKKKPFIVDNNKVYIDTLLSNNVKVTNANIDKASIDFAKIKDVKITNSHIDNASIEFGKIKDVVIKNANIEDATIKSAKIENGAITTLKIAGQNVTSGNLANNAAGHMMSGTSSFLISAGEKGAYITIIFMISESSSGPTREEKLYFGNMNNYAHSIRVPYPAGNLGGDAGGVYYAWKSVPGILRWEVGAGNHSVNVPSGCFAIAIAVNK